MLLRLPDNAGIPGASLLLGPGWFFAPLSVRLRSPGPSPAAGLAAWTLGSGAEKREGKAGEETGKLGTATGEQSLGPPASSPGSLRVPKR